MRLFIFLSLVVFLSTTVSAKKPKDKNKKEEHQKVEATVDKKEKSLSITASIFTSSEKTTLNNYRYTKTTKTLPKGLQKKVAKGGTLPPGWQKKLNKGEVIDSHTFQYAKPLPNELMIQLPKAPKGTIIVEIDGEIVRLAEATMTIIDILSHP